VRVGIVHDVFRFEIAVNDPCLMGSGERIGELSNERDGVRWGGWTVAVQIVCERFAIRPFESEIVESVGLAEVVSPYDTGVLDARAIASLA
jgi:hypothetical protein